MEHWWFLTPGSIHQVLRCRDVDKLACLAANPRAWPYGFKGSDESPLVGRLMATMEENGIQPGAWLPVVPEGDCTLEWLPQGWLTSPEERLEEHLKLATLLEAGWYGGDSQLSQWDRHAKYAAYELPGAARLSLRGATEAQAAKAQAATTAGAYFQEVWPVEGDAGLAPPAGGGGNPLPVAPGAPGGPRICSPSPPTLGSLPLGVLKKRKWGRQ